MWQDVEFDGKPHPQMQCKLLLTFGNPNIFMQHGHGLCPRNGYT
jgi:hypothetical protein